MQNKKVAVALLMIVALLATALALTTLYTVQNQMTITGYAEVQTEKPLGTKISSYDWGDFNKTDNTKTVTFWLRSLSNTPLNVTWQVIGLDDAFTFDLNDDKFEFTSYNETVAFDGTLTLVDYSEPPGAFSFALNFNEEA